MATITELAREILRLPVEQRRPAIDASAEPEALKTEIIRLWTRHKAFIVHAEGRRFPMISPESMTIDEATAWACGQFGRERVESVEEI